MSESPSPFLRAQDDVLTLVRPFGLYMYLPLIPELDDKIDTSLGSGQQLVSLA